MIKGRGATHGAARIATATERPRTCEGVTHRDGSYGKIACGLDTVGLSVVG